MMSWCLLSSLEFLVMNRPKRFFCRRARVLHFESMEQRQLLAADIGGLDDDVVQVSSALIGQVSTASVSASNADAGSTLGSAFDLGSVDGDVRIDGSVSFRDTLDVFRFDISRAADVDVDLRGLSRNADLIVVDHTGALVDTSRLAGNRSENLSLDLQAGTYFVAVQSRSFWGTSYQLTVSADLIAETPPEPEPESAPEVEFDPTTPFADVAYFGGTREWNINAVGAPEAWAAGFTGQGILVAVVDTGVDLDHPDLVGNLYVNPGEIAGNGIDDDGNGFIDDVSGYDFAGRDNDPNDVNGHGTHVAGTIAAGNNGFGATGIAPDARILPVRVLGDNGSGTTNAVAAGIRYAADLGAQIINLSLGGGYSRAVDAAIEYAQSLGSFIVAAAGNESASVPGFPARFSATDENVISVGAFSSSGSIAGFSNDVGNSGSVQIDAPGVGIFSTYAGGRYASLSGTSMASPHVAGVAALALSANPNLTPAQLRELLVGGVVGNASGSDAIGRLNAATTVAYASRGLTSAPTTAGASGSSVSGRDATSVQSMSLPAAELESLLAPIDVTTVSVAVAVDVVRDPVSTIDNATPERLVSAGQGQSQIENTFARFDAYFASDDSQSANDRDDGGQNDNGLGAIDSLEAIVDDLASRLT